jgi:hypothetical protein
MGRRRSRAGVLNPRVIHFPRQFDFWRPRWFKPKLQTFQERLVGGIALAAEIDVVGMPPYLQPTAGESCKR